MDVTVELKRKRGEILDRLVEIREMQASLETQMRAVDQVIAIYEPDYEPASAVARHKTRKKRQKAPETIEIDTLLGSIEPTNAVLEILREAAAPLTTADCAVRLMQKLGIAEGDPRTSRVATRLSVTLDRLMKKRRVRQAGKYDGRRYLWEIAA
jgi:hypothetical protein